MLRPLPAQSVRPTVWLLEDSPTEAQAALQALRERCELEHFSDGAVLLEALAQRPVRPDALVLDWHLPGMSGLEVCAWLRSRADLEALPVLLLTANRSPEHIAEGLAAGANDFVSKPFPAIELRARLDALLRTAQLRRRLLQDEQARRTLAERAVVELREAEAAAAARTDFERHLMGIVSHDLRSPLQAIDMAAHVLLRRADVTDGQRPVLERILSAAGRASRLTRDLLDFTQARLGGGVPVHRAPGDALAIVRHAVEELRGSNPGRTLALVEAGDGHGVWDADRLAQVVTNLGCNALAYSPEESPVHVEVRGTPDAVTLAVHNTGAPIPEALLPRLFQPLQRGVDTPSRERSVGLGLYIVDQLARAHGGSVHVHSTAAAGTTFTVRLPRAG